jgi:mono/diheme cytochrome c family protein
VNTSRQAWIATLSLLVVAAGPWAFAEDDGGFRDTVAPLLEKHCLRCHGPKEQDGELRLDAAASARDVQRKPRLWRLIADRLRSNEMPPEDEPQPTRSEVARITSWIETTLSSRPEASDPGRVTLRRLNRNEYNNTVGDLLNVALRPADAFPADDTGYGFDTIADVLSLPPILLEKYVAAAELIASRAVLVYAPTAKHFEAEAMLKSARGGNRDGWAFFSTNGDVSVQVRIRHPGTYRVRARAYGMQAGPQKVQLAFRIGSTRVATVKVAAERDTPKVYTRTVQLNEGSHTFGVGFVNDYYKPKDPDPKNRDRNMALDWVELEGPITPPVLPAFHARALGYGAPTRERVAQAIRDLVGRAFRREAADDDVARLIALYDLVRAEGDSPERGFQVVVQAVLLSPRFLFRFEAEPEGDAPSRALDDFELATRLSYFLWSSMPDDALFERARSGTLRVNQRSEVERLLDDPRSSALVENFAGQWLELRRLEELTPDPKTFPRFDEGLREAMVEESERVFEAILRERRSVLDFLRGRFTFVNGRLAKLYGIPGVQGSRFRRVALPQGRAGILTHASILTVTSNPTRTSPVKRGKWILDQILDAPPRDPPPGIADLPNTPAAKRKVSQRALLQEHRKRRECASCHTVMDPLGFGMEHFDGIGAWRERDGKFPIDASGELPGGVEFRGAEGLRDYLLERRSDEFVACLVRKLLTYAIGRGLREADEPAITELVRSLAPEYRFNDLIVGITQLDAFQRQGKKR